MDTKRPRKRALARYLGGKNRIAPWIISFFPEHRIYVEPFGGSAAVLLNKQPAFLEIYNDLYDRIVNFFEVLRDTEKAERLARLIELTPYAQEAYSRSFEIAEDTVEDALRFAVNSMMSYGGGIHKPGFKRNGLLRTTPYPKAWREYPDIVRECATELRNRNIEINEIDALEIMSRYDSEDTLHYVDPPYVQETRGNRVRYTHEYSLEDHEKLLAFLKTLKGKVVLSGYNSELYVRHLSGWRKECKEACDTQGNHKTECLWMNYKPQMMLF
ncbi:DNA adenine methylase [Akkermansia sp. N21116]|uniref:DNA adenine methylase n=1 Tax=Akkermansia sp. N21116 TaxID=3040764 RepID=UPI00244E609F|nr:DNA adenine methylase [Akkermansia sp. N21116]WPX39416.1 DNA adenine methylase [Akkermansia sp. N21116]